MANDGDTVKCQHCGRDTERGYLHVIGGILRCPKCWFDLAEKATPEEEKSWAEIRRDLEEYESGAYKGFFKGRKTR